jgi:hypothetical protein
VTCWSVLGRGIVECAPVGMEVRLDSTLCFDTKRLTSTYVVLVSRLMVYSYQSIRSVFDVGALSRQSLKLERSTGLGICYLSVIAVFFVYNSLRKSPQTSNKH